MHGFNLDDIQKMASQWEEAPPLYLQLDIKVCLNKVQGFVICFEPTCVVSPSISRDALDDEGIKGYGQFFGAII